MKDCEFLVIGSRGLLGSNIVKILRKKKINYLTVARSNSNFNLNLKNFKSLSKFFLKNRYKVVINCAAIIDINNCEKKYSEALIVNCKLVKFLSEMSKKFDFKFVQISTDHVYKGKRSKLNHEKSQIFAINKYAKTEVKYVCRGGIFGGRKAQINKANATYYSLLGLTLADGYMGTEECIFSIMANIDPVSYRRYELDGNGLIVKFTENVLKDNINLVDIPKQAKSKFNPAIYNNMEKLKTNLYILTF